MVLEWPVVAVPVVHEQEQGERCDEQRGHHLADPKAALSHPHEL
jgi:hypothetical protein